MDNRHNLSGGSAPWGNDVTRRTDSAVKSIDRLEQDFQQLTMQSSSALSRLTAGSGTLSQVLSYDALYVSEPFGDFMASYGAPSGATSVTVRFNNFLRLAGSTSTGGLLSFRVMTGEGGLGGRGLGYGPLWEVAPGGEPLGTVGRLSVTLPITEGESLGLNVEFQPHTFGNTGEDLSYRHNVHLIWGF